LDTYKTILSPSPETLLKEKNSKFFGYAFPVATEDEVKNHLSTLRKTHSGAGHFCYAYQIGTEKLYFRTNDDGEPNNSAGLPIYGQIQSFGLTNVLIVVVRYFGGVKLGVGGLISAYKESAQMTLENSEIIEKSNNLNYTLLFDYKHMNKVMRTIKEKNVQIISQRMDADCQIEVAIPKKFADVILASFQSIYEIEIKERITN
jgi:uncharacterized YigZ family protein